MNKWITRAALLLLTGVLAAGCLYAVSTERGTVSSGGTGVAGDGSGTVRILEADEYRRETEGKAEEPFSGEDLVWQGGRAACETSASAVYIPCDPEIVQTWESAWNEQDEETASAEASEAGQDDGNTEEKSDSGIPGVNDQWEELLEGLAPASGKGEIFFQEDPYLLTPAAAMREGHAFRACLCTEKTVRSFSIVLTGLPVLCMTKTDQEEIRRKEVHTGLITLIEPWSAQNPTEDPMEIPAEAGQTETRLAEIGAGTERGSGAGSKTENGAISKTEAETRTGQLRCTFHVRGNVTSTLAKKPYRVSLLDAAGGKVKVSWLGLRSDDDWILNPLYTDATRVREKTAYALWEEAAACAEAPQPSSHLRYVELFMDDACQGIYCLMEPVDGKQLGLEAGDLLYKIDRWDYEYPYLDLYGDAQAAQETEIYNDYGFPCVEIKYPRTWDGTASWDPMRLYHDFSFRTGDPAALTEAGLQTDLDSVVTLSLFCAMTHAMDNNWKNSFLIAYAADGAAQKTGEGSYVLRRTTWDLNYIFGDVFLFDPEKGYTEFDPGTAFLYTPGQDSTFDFEAFLAADPSLEDALRDKWAVWRKAGISADRIIALARENRDLLLQSGAMEREKSLWPQETDDQEAMDRMETWIRRRFLFLDEIFGYQEP